MFGLVGPNGAGKTTTLSMATGLLRPDAGRAEVLGHDVWTDPAAAKALIGVLPDGLRLFDRLSGAELLRYVGLLRRVPPADIASRSAELLEALEPGRRPQHPGGRVLRRHDQEDRPGLRADPRAAAADLGRAVRGGGPGVRGGHPVDPAQLRPRRRHGGDVQPRDGAGGEPVRRAGRGGPGPGAGRRARWTRSAPARRLQHRFLELVGFTAAGEESLAWLRSSSGSS